MKKLIIVLLAMMIVISIPVQAARVYYVKSGDSLWKVSQKLDIPLETLYKANNYSSSLYVGQKIVFGTDDKDERTQSYTVKSGDTLWKIANKFNSSIEKIVELNNIGDNYLVYIGQKLTVPAQAVQDTDNSNNSDNSNSDDYYYYTIKSGDILWYIAQRFNTTVQKLINLNNIKNAYDLYPGRRLKIYEQQNDTGPVADYSNYNPYYFYEMKEGDRIWNIADKFGIRVSVLINYNNIDNVNNLEPGDIIIVPMNRVNNLNYLKRATSQINNYYRVTNNETLADITEYYEIPEAGLRAINNMTEQEEVYPGQKLKMPVNPALFEKHELYRVKGDGEYLFDIAYNKSVSIRSILKANYMRNPNKKFSGGEVVLISLTEESKATWIDYENGEPVNSPWF